MTKLPNDTFPRIYPLLSNTELYYVRRWWDAMGTIKLGWCRDQDEFSSRMVMVDLNKKIATK